MMRYTATVIILLSLIIGGYIAFFYKKDNFVKVGILHSLTGTMATAESPIVDILKYGINEINAKGGILGKKIIPVVYDAKSDLEEFKKGATYLLEDEKVLAIFGCWTSASRKA